MRVKYPSDITREQFELIRSELEGARKSTHPRTVDSYDVFCGVLYRLREGCRWRSLPHDYPKWQLCYYHYEIWRSAEEGAESELDRVLRKLVEAERVLDGRAPQTTMSIIDSKTIQNTDTAEEKGYDAGKKSPG
jgi:transposase